MKLIIVESPTKGRTLARFLGNDYRVEATMGHIRDLPKSKLGVDVEHDFLPSYVVPKDRQKRVGELRDLADSAQTVILATDPDREGEAIAFHMAELLKSKSQITNSKTQINPKSKNKKTKSISFQRIVFHEITESAIKDALANPRDIDIHLVDAQQARRVLDRLVGYKLSPLLWQKLSRRWLSAGRVQSVAVRLIVEREREIEAFAKQEYWTIEGLFLQEVQKDSRGRTHAFDVIHAQLVSLEGVKLEKKDVFALFDGIYTTTKTSISSESAAHDIIAGLKPPFLVSAFDTKEIKRSPAPPFTTSTLQQEAGRRLYFSAKRTMQLAQKLYEEGFITYHRTDSVNLSQKYIAMARDYIKKTWGAQYIPVLPRTYQTKSKVAQEAHEAIRPTDVMMTPDALQSKNEGEFNRDHVRLYELIWKRAVACQSKEAVFDATTVVIESRNNYIFEAKGSVIKFDGYLAITGRDTDEIIIPNLTVGQILSLEKAIPSQHFTSPAPRYTEASLVKTLEEKDIGRPSTYAPIITTIQDRQYVAKSGKMLVPSELGFAVTDFLVKYFPTILDLPFTADLEEKLDAIARGESAWQPVIGEFYEPFSQALAATYQDADKVKLEVIFLDEACPQCTHSLVVRTGRFGKFIACSTFPACTYTRQWAEKTDTACPRCGGVIVIKKSRHGKTFYGCSNYPTCTFAAWKKEDIK